jgi:hypothetical protein
MNLSKSNIYGYPIRIIIDKKKRLWPTPILEIISYNEYIQTNNITINLSEHPYNYWIPCYISEEHFNKIKNILNVSLMILYTNGEQEQKFNPISILYIFPKIISQTLLLLPNIFLSLFSKNNNKDKIDINKSNDIVNLINCYSNFIYLFKKYLDMYPKLYDNIDNDIKLFINNSKNRNRNKILDLNEFYIKILFSKTYTFNDLRCSFIKEYISRQFYWTIKFIYLNKKIRNYNDININKCYSIMRNSLFVLFNSILISNFINNSKENEFNILNTDNGFCNNELIKKIILHITDNIQYFNNFNSLLSFLTNKKYINDDDVKKYLYSCYNEALNQKYIVFNYLQYR